MRLTARHQLLGLLAVTLVGCTLAAPLPAPSPSPRSNEKQNSIDAYEDGLLLFVPTIPAADREKSGKELKREIEYELIAIPGDILRREIRQVAQQYGVPSFSSGGSGSVVAQSDSIHDFGEIIIPRPPVSQIYDAPSISFPSKPRITLPTINVSIKPDFGSVISSLTGQATDYAGGAGQTLANVGLAGSNVLGQVGSAAATSGVQLASWLVDQKSQGISTATQVVGGGLQYAGQLSSGVLRALLRVPGIKARVLSEVIEASQPLVYAVSDVLADSSGDLADFFEAKTSVLSDAVGIIIRLIQDTLALKGRIIYSLSSSGLDIGATAFNAGAKIGGAAVESATGIASAVGSGVADLVAVGKSVNLPPLPPLPQFSLPTLPIIDVPKITIPSVDLSGLVPSVALSPLALPGKPSYSTVVSTPNQAYGAPYVSPPTQLYSGPGR